MPRKGLVISMVWAAAVAACGGAGVEGRYTGQGGDAFFDSLTFRSDGKVEIVLVGVTHEGVYTVDGGNVTITAPNGDQNVLALDSNGCLSHQIAGTYCRSGGAAAAVSGSPATTAGVFEATAQEGRITLELGAGRQVRVTMTPNPGSDMPNRMSFDATYDAHDGGMIINLPGDEPLRLTRSGNDLEGTMNGETVRFVRR